MLSLRKMQRKDFATDTKLVPYLKELIDFINFLNHFILERTSRELDLLVLLPFNLSVSAFSIWDL